jgi:hypothetical protein
MEQAPARANSAALQMGLQWGFSSDFAAELLRDDNLDDLEALHSDLLSSPPKAYVHPARGTAGRARDWKPHVATRKCTGCRCF